MAAIILTILQTIVNFVISILDFIAVVIQNSVQLLVQHFWQIMGSYGRRFAVGIFTTTKLGVKTQQKLHKTKKRLKKHSKRIKRKVVFDQRKIVRARNI